MAKKQQTRGTNFPSPEKGEQAMIEGIFEGSPDAVGDVPRTTCMYC